VRRTTIAVVLALALAGCAATEPVYDTASAAPAPEDWIAALVGSADRTEADRALDAGRRPAELLAFIGVASGMRIAELGAGSGYTTELLARAVGPTGVVYGQNDPVVLERFAAAPWGERLASPAMANVVRLDRPFDDPFPPEVSDLDAVIIVLFYHDTVWLEADRDRMNRAVFSALKPGGAYYVIDHSSWP
jgi:predicted methyltransferase